MQGRPRQIEYSLSRIHYSISNLHPRHLQITVEDLQKKLKRNTFVDDSLLQTYSLSTEQLYQIMFRQFVYSSKAPKKMIKFEEGEMLINLDYPKTPIAQLRFKYEQVSLDQSAVIIEKINQLFDKRVQQLQIIFQALKQKIQNQIYQRLLSIFQKIQKKAQDVSKVFDLSASNKATSFDAYVNSKEKQYESRFSKFIEDSVSKLVSENNKLKRQIEMITIRLSNSVSILDQNIQVQQARIDDLEKDIDYNQQRNQEEISNLQVKMQNIAHQLNEKIDKLISQFNQSLIVRDKDKEKSDQQQNQSIKKEQKSIRFEQNIEELIVKTRKKSQQYVLQKCQYEQTIFKSEDNFAFYASCENDLIEGNLSFNK